MDNFGNTYNKYGGFGHGPNYGLDNINYGNEEPDGLFERPNVFGSRYLLPSWHRNSYYGPGYDNSLLGSTSSNNIDPGSLLAQAYETKYDPEYRAVDGFRTGIYPFSKKQSQESSNTLREDLI